MSAETAWLDDLDAERVLARLHTTRYGRSLCLLAETGSTNDDARIAAEAGLPSGHTVVADHQRAGRGSRGRSWSSTAGTDLYVSIVDRPSLPLHALPPLTLAVGLGVADTIARYVEAPDAVAIKWPNDVWLRGRKCAGILVEAASSGTEVSSLVIGIGLNVNRDRWTSELGDRATSMRAGPALHATGAVMANPVHRLRRDEVLAHLLEDVERWVECFVQEGSERLAQALNPRLALLGSRVRCGGQEGILLGVAATGALRVQTSQGEVELIAGTLEAC